MNLRKRVGEVRTMEDMMTPTFAWRSKTTYEMVVGFVVGVSEEVSNLT